MKPEVVLRADAGTGIGLGHIRRCLALAQAFKRTGKVAVSFVTQTPETVEQWVGNRFPVHSISQRALSLEPAWWKTFLKPDRHKLIIFDRYGLPPAYFRTLKKAGVYIALIDDEANKKSYPLDCIINYNAHASRTCYPSPSSALFLLGPRFALIGEEFLRSRKLRKPRKVCRTLFTGLGGFAPEHAKNRLETIALQLGLKVIRMEGRTHSVAAFLSRADLAVSASGVTSYELACLGIPTLLVVVAENQKAIARALARRKAAINLGWFEKASDRKLKTAVEKLVNDSAARKSMSRSAFKLIDGQGASRTAKALIHSFIEMTKESV